MIYVIIIYLFVGVISGSLYIMYINNSQDKHEFDMNVFTILVLLPPLTTTVFICILLAKCFEHMYNIFKK